MKLQIEIEDSVLSQAVSEHLANKDVLRESIAKAFNKSEFVAMFSDWLRGELSETLKTTLANETVKAAILSGIDAATHAVIDSVAPEIQKLRKSIGDLKEQRAVDASANTPLHPSIAKRIR